MIRRYLPVAVFFSVALASLFLAGYSYMQAHEAGKIKFAAAADDATSRIETRVDQHLSLLHASAAFIEARGGDISRADFDRFISFIDLRRRYPGVRGIGYAPVVPRGAEGPIQASLMRSYRSERGIWPNTDQDIRAPVMLLAPPDTEPSAAIGYDMFSEPDRRAAMQDAMRSGQMRATPRINLVAGQGQRSFPGFIVYLPLEAGVTPPRDGDSAEGAVRGFLYAAFRAGELFDAALTKTPVLPVSVRVRDAAQADDRPLYASQAEPGGRLTEGLSVSRELTIAGRRWVLDFEPNADFEMPSSRIVPVSLGLFGLLLAAAIAYVARLREQAYDAATALQQAAEKNLLEKDLMLQEMKHRIKNSIARVLAIARQTASGAASVEEFSASFSARLQAMATSQDMLTRSRWQKADLEELLRTELEQVFGKNFEAGMLRGPRVKLDEATTQALGLTFHELATNALKYGEIGSGGTLKVEWRTEGSGKAKTLAIAWSETGSRPVDPPEKKGFGTRLIEMNVARELGGTIDRDYREDGLTIRLTTPLRREDARKAKAEPTAAT